MWKFTTRTLEIDQQEFCIYESKSSTGPTFVLHHGAGHSALSFCLMAGYLSNLLECSIVAYDCRGHGQTRASQQDLSLERLSLDLVHIVNSLDCKDIILVGHSMGGAVVVDSHSKGVRGVIGTVVLDVVEGTAMESLVHMKHILNIRPKSFKTLEEGIQWGIRNQVRNQESAKISIPSQLKQTSDGYTWITDLNLTREFWNGWFEGLSNKFLAMRGARLLVLAGTDRLDKVLTIGQMQGKFQLIILPEAGHTIQEDQPERLATCLFEFWDRNKPLKEIKRFPIPPKK